ncbi:MAG: helix-turn-helix transcriptional regulator [Bryobacterales bacterium]|nr:helix-turn-helix transcriptional regulator [Bryobacterales bacterium]
MGGIAEASATPLLTAEWVTLTMHQITDGDLPPGTAEHPSLLMQLSAPVVIELCLNGHYQERTVRPGDFCIAPPGPVPAARWQGQRSILVAALHPRLLHSVAAAQGIHGFELRPRHVIADPQISHLLFALHAEVSTPNPVGKAYVEAICRALSMRLLLGHAETMGPTARRGGLTRSCLRRVLEYMDSHLEYGLPLRSLAEVSGLSVDHFSRAFRESTGETPHRYLLRRRLARARRLLLRTDQPIADIALALGFTDQSHLTNLFRRHYSTTPGRVRLTREDVEAGAGILQ